jgi:D-3-phosphoglycerate dehydrogenase / 2-oxoglutarate reductase
MIDSLALLYAPAGPPAMARLGGRALLGERLAAHLLSINSYRLDLPLSSGGWLDTRHHDRPGIIGAVGQLLGDASITIGFMQLGRDEPHAMALMVVGVGVDAPVPDDVFAHVKALPPLASAPRLTFSD